MRTPRFIVLVSSLVLLSNCSNGGPSPAASSNQPPEIPINSKPVRPPVTTETCSSTETFSFSPSLGTTSLAPKEIDVPLGGFNGNTWDGRIFIKIHHHPENSRVGWWLSVFRPERLKTDEKGYPDFSQEAVSEPVEWFTNKDTKADYMHIGIYPNTEFEQNPFRSNRNGDADSNGRYETYEVYIMAPLLTDESQMHMRRGKIIVARPKTADAYVIEARWTSEFQEMKTVSGKRIRGLEPSITADGRLLVYNGHPKNDGDILIITYSYNPIAGATTGWSEPRSINDMYYVDRNKLIDGIPFHERYPISKKPLMDQNGQTYKKDELYSGAYPWISLDGTEVFHTSFNAGCDIDNMKCPEWRRGERTLRGGLSVIGRWTNYTMRMVDSAANVDRFSEGPVQTIRTLTSGISTFGNMWESYREVANVPLPYTPRRPSYGLIGNVRHEYTEASFEDAMDGNYVLFLRMNEFVSREKVKWFWEKPNLEHKIFADRTPDTSTNSNHGSLKNGAAFPQEYNGFDGNIGKSGQAVYFPDNGRIEVANSQSLNNLSNGLSVELWVKREADISKDEYNRFRYLIRKGRSFDLIAEETRQIQASVSLRLPNGSVVRRRSGNLSLLVGWTHVAFTYEPASGKMRVYVNGALVNESQFEAAPLASDDSALVIGPGGQVTPLWTDQKRALFSIDEVKISNIVRTHNEIKASAFVSNQEQFTPIGRSLPLGLRANETKVPTSNPVTDASIALGERLFNDPLLSRNRDMSCATCHKSDRAFTDNLPRALGFEGKVLRRNTPSIFNRAFSAVQFWDGGANTLEEQALMPITSPEEMNLPLSDAIARLKADPSYVQSFSRTFGREPNSSDLARALASFQRSQLVGGSRVDRYENGELSALNESEIRGRILFLGKGRCIGCHVGSNYTNESFHFTGFTCTSDHGREEATGRARDRRLFKTPSLRSVLHTAPYLHDGSLNSLEEVVDTYNRGGLFVENRDTEIKALGLTNQEKQDLVNFLKAL